jgi:ADP-ribose diphosphatase
MAQRDRDKEKPQILEQKLVAESRLFKIEQLDLQFSNGEQRTYERMKGGIREYCAGTHDYQLGFPKGLIDPGETVVEAANRELQEEIGFKAGRLIPLKTVALAPGYFSATMHIVLALDLTASSLPGDEPEPLELVPWQWQQQFELLDQSDFTEARSVAALFLARDYLDKHQDVFK